MRLGLTTGASAIGMDHIQGGGFSLRRSPMMKLWFRAQGKSVQSLLNNRYWDMESTDPRDKIYGLLGLLKFQNHGIDPSDSEPFTVDYTKSTLEVFSDVLRYLETCRSFRSIVIKPSLLIFSGTR